MALTKKFKETVVKRAQSDLEFRRAMLCEAISAFLNDEVEVAKSLLRDYINATIQFIPLAKQLEINNKSLQRMFGPSGNPTSKTLFSVIHELQKLEGIKKIDISFH